MNAETPQPPPSDESAPQKPGQDVRETLRRLGPLGPLAVVSVTLPGVGGFLLLYYINDLAAWFRSHGDVGPALYVLLFALSSGLALLPTYAQSALGGWAFGAWRGSAAASAGFALGAVLGWGVARAAGGDRARALIDENRKWKAVYEALLGGGWLRTLGIVALLRLPPNSPFAATNLVLAAAGVRLPVFALGTLIGLAPRSCAAAFLAAGLREFSMGGLKRPWLMPTGIVVTVAVLVIIGMLANNALQRMTRDGPGTVEPNRTHVG
ncbi:MAG: hypothetical protein CHACPFDD_01136 [Phycisphaerae bacterium]|nr:hypothetical protein [Phycisphaerae bacterium]